MIKKFFKKNCRILLIWSIIVLTVFIGKYFHLDKKIMTFGVIIFGILTQAFLWLLRIIGLIPIIGPIIVKIITLPVIWLTNGLIYVITLIALKKGSKMEILKSRILVVSFIIGTVVGFILGKLL